MSWPKDTSDDREALRLLRENNATLKQIIAYLASNNRNNVGSNFLVDVLANLTADGISRGGGL